VGGLGSIIDLYGEPAADLGASTVILRFAMLRVDYGVKSQGTVSMARLGVLILTCLLLLPRDAAISSWS